MHGPVEPLGKVESFSSHSSPDKVSPHLTLKTEKDCVSHSLSLPGSSSVVTAKKPGFLFVK